MWYFRLQMRTFPKPLAAFRKIVDERVEQIRRLSFADLKQRICQVDNCPVEHLTVESGSADIGTIVEPTKDGSLRVVIQGFMKGKLFGNSVAMDGFYKHPDGSVTALSYDDFCQFD